LIIRVGQWKKRPNRPNSYFERNVSRVVFDIILSIQPVRVLSWNQYTWICTYTCIGIWRCLGGRRLSAAYNIFTRARREKTKSERPQKPSSWFRFKSKTSCARYYLCTQSRLRTTRRITVRFFVSPSCEITNTCLSFRCAHERWILVCRVTPSQVDKYTVFRVKYDVTLPSSVLLRKNVSSPQRLLPVVLCVFEYFIITLVVYVAIGFCTILFRPSALVFLQSSVHISIKDLPIAIYCFATFVVGNYSSTLMSYDYRQKRMPVYTIRSTYNNTYWVM